MHLRTVALKCLAKIGGWGDHLTGTDPGLLRLTMALQGTVSVFLATVAAVVAGHLGGFQPVECASGVTLSMMAPFLMREPTARQRMRTLAALLIPAIAATLLTAVLHGHGPAGDSLFLLLVFLCFLLAPRSQRGVGLGLVAIVTTYVGLYLELPPATLPVQVGAQLLVLPVIALACFVLVPLNPAATLRGIVAAVQARAAQVIRQIETPDAADPTAGENLGLRRALLRLNEAALAADDQLSIFEPGLAGPLRFRLVDVELRTARLLEAVRTEQPDRRTAARLSLHARRIARGGRYATQPGQLRHGSVVAALVALGTAVHALGLATRKREQTEPQPKPAPAVWAAPGPLAWRLATRVTLAAAFAMAGGMALSPQRWFWAVITVYVMFLNTRSRGDTIYKGIQRLVGTLLGIASGLLLAIMVAADPVLESVMLLGCVFGMYYFFLVSYTVGIFFVTIMLGLLYGLLGAPLETVLELRMEETLIGASAAIVVVAFVFPNRTREQVRKSGRAVLAQLAQLVRSSAGALSGHPSPAPIEAMRAVDRQVADLKLALAPLLAGRALLRRSPAGRPVSALLDCVHWARMLAAEGQTRPEPQLSKAEETALSSEIERIAAGLDGLARGEVLQFEPGQGFDAGDVFGKAVHGLAQAVAILAKRLEISAYEAFAFEA